MANPKCNRCSKIIPDGFADCPWCGATQSVANSSPAAAPAAAGAAKPLNASGPDFLAGLSLLLSAAVFATLQYLAMVRTVGPLTLENSGYFLGRCAGSLILSAIIVLAYNKIRGTELRTARALFVIIAAASLLTAMNLAAPSKHRSSAPDAAAIHQLAEDIKSPDSSNKWASPARSLMTDLVARNQQYVSDVSALDNTAKPLYTVESFSTTANIQQMIAQLNARLAVADKYTSLQPVFAKMKDYVAKVDASDADKRDFMDGFESTLPKTLSAHKALVDKEHAWLQSSLDLYQYALSRQGAYVYQDRNLLFKKIADSAAFNQKLVKAHTLKAEFLKSYWDARRAQKAVIVQMGLQGTEFGPMPSQ